MRPNRDVRIVPALAAVLMITAALGLAAAGCANPTLSEEGGFSCTTAAPDCPEGFECKAGHCLPTGTSLDSGADAPAVDTAQPDVLGPDTAQPDAELPDATLPDAPIPDAPIPDQPLPDTAVPDLPLPDTAVPDLPLPDSPTPDVMPSKCTATTCNKHGTCNDSSGTAVCTCNTGYALPDCFKCASGYLLHATNSTCIASPCVPDPCVGVGGSAGSCIPSSGGKVTVGSTQKDDNPYDLFGCACNTSAAPGTVSISQVKLDGAGSATAHPGFKYDYSLKYTATPPSSCTNCKLQLVVGYAASHHHNDAHLCREITVSKSCLTGMLQGKIGAPRKLGSYDFRVGSYFLSDCTAAMAAFTNGTAGTKQGSLTVSEVKCYSEYAYAKTFLVNGSASPATVSKGASITVSTEIASSSSTNCPGCVITAYAALANGAGGHIGLLCYSVPKSVCPTAPSVKTVTNTIVAPSVAGMYRVNLSTLAEYTSACVTYLYKTAAYNYAPERTIGLIKVQ